MAAGNKKSQAHAAMAAWAQETKRGCLVGFQPVVAPSGVGGEKHGEGADTLCKVDNLVGGGHDAAGMHNLGQAHKPLVGHGDDTLVGLYHNKKESWLPVP